MCEVFITNRDPTGATSMVYGTRRCHQLLQRERRRLFLHMYMAEWQNLACVHTSVTFFPLSFPGSCQITCIWPLITALATRSKPTCLRSMVFRPRTHQNLQGLKTTTKDPCWSPICDDCHKCHSSDKVQTELRDACHARSEPTTSRCLGSLRETRWQRAEFTTALAAEQADLT